MEGSNVSLMTHIKQASAKMSKGQKAIAAFILNDYDKAAYLTAARIGEEAGVSESTVVRFAMELGFEGYPHFQKALQEELKVKLTAAQRFKASARLAETHDILTTVLQADIDKLRRTSERIDREAFAECVEALLSAQRIYILGVRSSASLASFLGFYFNLIFDNIRLVQTTSVSEMFEQILTVREGDVVIGISFPRYSRRTIKAMQYARDSGATVIAITDKKDNPVAGSADLALYAPSDMMSFADSLVAPLSVINALIVAVALRLKDHVNEHLEKLEHIWDEYDVYDKGELS